MLSEVGYASVVALKIQPIEREDGSSATLILTDMYIQVRSARKSQLMVAGGEPPATIN